MTIADKLALLEQTKEAQRIKLGLPESLPFSRYHEFFEFKFVPSYLFLNGEQGVWFDPSDLSTMFQDVNGFEPVTKNGDPVALIKDKSGNNNHATQETASARPIYRTDGNLHWLEFDGVDDFLIINRDLSVGRTHTLLQALKINVKGPQQEILEFCNYPAGGGFRTLYYSEKLTLQLRYKKETLGLELPYAANETTLFSVVINGTKLEIQSNARKDSVTVDNTHTPSTIDYSLIGQQLGSRHFLAASVYKIVTVNKAVDTTVLIESLAEELGITL